MLNQLKSNRAAYDILVLLLSYPEKRGTLTAEHLQVDEEEESDQKDAKSHGEEPGDHSSIQGEDCYNVRKENVSND